VPRRDGRIVISNERGRDLHPTTPQLVFKLTGTSHQALSTITALSHPGTLVGFVQRRQMSYPFLALALAKFNACYRSSPQWHSARAGNSCPDCRLNLGAKSDLPTFQLPRFTKTRDRRQETGDRRQETGRWRQETGDRRWETGRRGDSQETGELPISPAPAPHLPCSPSPLLPISPAPPSPAPHLTISPIPTPLTLSPKCKPESPSRAPLIAP